MEAREQILVGIRDRLKKAMGRDHSGASLSRDTGGAISAKAINDWTNDNIENREPGVVSLALVARRLNLSLDWLVFGDDWAGEDVSVSNLDEEEAILALETTPKTQRRTKVIAKLDKAPQPVRVASDGHRRVKVMRPEERRELTKRISALLKDAVPDLVAVWEDMMHQWNKALEKAGRS